jgi:catechol 2,3-dioxygenase-like lactoylglutathione lyase family enzyme
LLRRLDIVQIKVRDWPSAVRWYTENLGLELTAYEEDHQYCWLRFPEGETRIALHGQPDLAAGNTAPRCVPVIYVDSLDSVLEALQAKGIHRASDITGEEEGYRTASVKDPEGNVVQFYEWTRKD